MLLVLILVLILIFTNTNTVIDIDTDTDCKYGDRCDCHCAVCTAGVPLLQAAVCPSEGQQPRLSCVLQDCEHCGLERALVCQTKEANGAAYLRGKVRLLRTVTRSIPGYDDRKKQEPVSIACSLEQVFDEIRDTFSFTLMHDYMATRLANQFHFDLFNLPADEEVWVMDYIENFSCFQEYQFQQDHYDHDSVTIFVILCIRHRRLGEEVQPSFKLPANLTAELHAFLSSDRDHDSGFAQLCIHMVMSGHRVRQYCVQYFVSSMLYRLACVRLIRAHGESPLSSHDHYSLMATKLRTQYLLTSTLYHILYALKPHLH